jgi:predicted PurR-regulated permease PerM
MRDDRRFRKGFLLGLVLAITAAFLYVVGAFLMTVFMAAIFAGLAHPFYRRLTTMLGERPALASALTLLTMVTLLVVPLVVVGSLVTTEALRITQNVTPWVTAMANEPTQLSKYLDRIPGIEHLAPYREQIIVKAGETVGGLSAVILASVSGLTRNTLELAVNFFLMLYAMFFFLIDGPRYLDLLQRYLPLRATEHNQMLERFVSVTRATLKGTLLIGVVQGVLGGIIFAVLGLSGAVLWGVVMTVLSVVPLIGGALVWVPAAIILAAQGAWVKAIILVAFCSLVIGSVDNVLRPYLVGQDIEMSDLMILFSTLGGIAVFGALGFIIGPIIAALFVTVWEIFAQAYREDLEVEPTVHL